MSQAVNRETQRYVIIEQRQAREESVPSTLTTRGRGERARRACGRRRWGCQMARRGDGIYQRGKTWWLDFRHDGQRHVARLGKGINRTVAGELARVKRAARRRGR